MVAIKTAMLSKEAKKKKNNNNNNNIGMSYWILFISTWSDLINVSLEIDCLLRLL